MKNIENSKKEQVIKEYVRCDKCGYEFSKKDYAKFCPNCGNVLDNSAQPNTVVKILSIFLLSLTTVIATTLTTGFFTAVFDLVLTGNSHSFMNVLGDTGLIIAFVPIMLPIIIACVGVIGGAIGGVIIATFVGLLKMYKRYGLGIRSSVKRPYNVKLGSISLLFMLSTSSIYSLCKLVHYALFFDEAAGVYINFGLSAVLSLSSLIIFFIEFSMTSAYSFGFCLILFINDTIFSG